MDEYRYDHEIEMLGEAICWLAKALVDSEGLRIRMMQQSEERHDMELECPVVRGIKENMLIVNLAKHAPDEMPFDLLKRLLEVKHGK